MPTPSELIKKRYSCRSYSGEPLSDQDIKRLTDKISGYTTGPLGTGLRFKLETAAAEDSNSLRDLGTYGFIKDPAAFVIGAVKNSGKDLEDYGYIMEKIILEATSMNLGTCWLGGSFRRSGFAGRIKLKDDESLPAVAAAGYIAERETIRDRLVKTGAGSKKRKNGRELFFDESLSPLDMNTESGYGKALEMVRLATSASNKQPWRIVKSGSSRFHFYIERSPVYTMTNRILKLADLQRIDIGISMCHFELSALEERLTGYWNVETTLSSKVPADWLYIVSWNGE